MEHPIRQLVRNLCRQRRLERAQRLALLGSQNEISCEQRAEWECGRALWAVDEQLLGFEQRASGGEDESAYWGLMLVRSGSLPFDRRSLDPGLMQRRGTTGFRPSVRLHSYA